MTENAETVLAFWLTGVGPGRWFQADQALDEQIGSRFGQTLAKARRAELWPWRQTARGRLAEIILLDQFSRNVFRNRPEAFACDGMALVLAQEAVARGADREPDVQEGRLFFYMPWMHAESATIQADGMPLFEALGNPVTLDYAERHRKVIDRFSRFPHRNRILGRTSSPGEEAFMLETPPF